MHIANKRRFGAFLIAIVLLLAAGGFLWNVFRPLPLLDVVSGAVDIEQLTKIELTGVTAENLPAPVILTQPSDIRACLTPLADAIVKREVKSGVRTATPGESFFLRLTDAHGHEAVLDVAGRNLVFDLNNAYYLVEPESLSGLETVRASIEARLAA